MSKSNRNQYKPTQFREDLIREVPDLVQKRMVKLDKHIIDKNELVSEWVTCLYTANKLQALPPNTRRNYESLSQLLQYMTTTSLEAYLSKKVLVALRTLQRDDFLGQGEKPVPRYNPKGHKNKKDRTKSNETSKRMFMRR